MTEQERYEKIDMPFYREIVAPVLPDKVLDFHVHLWEKEHWITDEPVSASAEAQYVTVQKEYLYEQLLHDNKYLYPDRESFSVCFSFPTPLFDIEKGNEYIKKTGKQKSLYTLLLTGRNTLPPSELRRTILEDNFFGYKVFQCWIGNNYGHITIEDMIGPQEMELANELGLAVLLHVPRDGRLGDSIVQKGVRNLSEKYPNANILLPHCGRAYLPDEMAASIDSIKGLENVYLGTTMVMDPTVLQIVFENIDSRRVFFGTDTPIALMRGRRVYVMDHWVDMVLDSWAPAKYRVITDNMRATFMVYETILAVRRAAERVGLSTEQTRSIFYDNGMSILNHVMEGWQLKNTESRWVENK